MPHSSLTHESSKKEISYWDNEWLLQARQTHKQFFEYLEQEGAHSEEDIIEEYLI